MRKKEKTTDQKWTNLHKNEENNVKPAYWGYWILFLISIRIFKKQTNVQRYKSPFN